MGRRRRQFCGTLTGFGDETTHTQGKRSSANPGLLSRTLSGFSERSIYSFNRVELQSGFEIAGQGAILELADAGDDRGGVELGAFERGVGVIGRAEERFYFGLAHFVQFIRGDFIEIDERRAALLSGFGGPFAVIGGGAQDLAVFPHVARDLGEDDRRGALGLGVGDDLAQIPAVSVNDFLLAGGFPYNFLGFLAVALDRGSRARTGIVTAAAVVVAELHQDEVAGLELVGDFLPKAFGDVGAAGAAAEGAVDDIDFGGVEERRDLVAPTPEAALAFAGAVFDGGVADEVEGGFYGGGGVGGAGESGGEEQGEQRAGEGAREAAGGGWGWDRDRDRVGHRGVSF